MHDHKDKYNYAPPPTNDVQRITKIYLVGSFLIASPFLALIVLSSVYIARMTPATEQKLFALLDAKSERRKIGGPTHERAEHKTAQAGLEAYLNELTARLQAAQRRFPYGTIRVHIRCDPEANAYAVPGNKIYITYGLLKTLHTENGLAFVLGHELGHFAYRHHVKGIHRYLTASFLHLLFGAAGPVDLALEASTSAFDQKEEAVADRYGLRLVIATYGHGQGADELFQDDRRRDELLRGISFLLSHPLSEVRIRNIRKWQGEKTGNPRELPPGLLDGVCASMESKGQMRGG